MDIVSKDVVTLDPWRVCNQLASAATYIILSGAFELARHSQYFYHVQLKWSDDQREDADQRLSAQPLQRPCISSAVSGPIVLHLPKGTVEGTRARSCGSLSNSVHVRCGCERVDCTCPRPCTRPQVAGKQQLASTANCRWRLFARADSGAHVNGRQQHARLWSTPQRPVNMATMLGITETIGGECTIHRCIWTRGCLRKAPAWARCLIAVAFFTCDSMQGSTQHS